VNARAVLAAACVAMYVVLFVGWSAARAGQPRLDFTPDERAQILSHGPWPSPVVPDAANRAQGRPAAVAWGRELFHDKRLSRSGQVSCASCHVPKQAFQDGLPTARAGDDATPGRRNTPSVLDSDLRRWLGWDGAHDSLWAASLAPLLARDEMGQGVADLAALVRRTADLQRGYRRAFAQTLPADDEQLVVDLAKALAAYQATLRSPRTPFDDFRDALARGDVRAASRYPAAAQRGLRLFIGHGRCSVCHAGPAFSNGEFADIGVPFFVPGGVDPGRHGGLQAVQASRMNRLGPFSDAQALGAKMADPRSVTTRHVVIEPRHFGEFRVPGLRQLTRTAPYMHNGSLATVEAVVRHYDQLNEDRLHADGERILRRLDLTPAQAADLAAFLRSLSR